MLVRWCLPQLFLFLALPICHAHGEDAGTCPAVPDFSRFFPKVPDLGRRLRVACPCIGVHAAGYALNCMQVPFDTCNAFDLEAGYRQVLTQQLLRDGMDVIRLRLGKIDGNLLSCSLSQLEWPIDFLISGPPCPPWSGQGTRGGRRNGKHIFMIESLILGSRV